MTEGAYGINDLVGRNFIYGKLYYKDSRTREQFPAEIVPKGPLGEGCGVNVVELVVGSWVGEIAHRNFHRDSRSP